MIKLHARSRAQLIVFAYESRLVLPRPPRGLAGHRSHQTAVALGPERVAPRTRPGSTFASVAA